MTKFSILHIIPFAHIGGTEKDCYFIIKEGKDFRHEVLVLDTIGPMVAQWQNVGANVECLNILKSSNKELARALKKRTENNKYSGILYWSTIKLPIIRYALRNMPIIMIVHVGNPCQLSRISTLKQMLYQTFFRSKIQTYLFACSEYVENSLKINLFYKKFPTSVSMNPVELLSFNPYKVRELNTYSEIVIGMTARLDPIKDHRTVLTAFSYIVKSYPNAKLWLIGDGVLKNDLEILADQLNVKNNTIFWGNIEDVYLKLQLVDIFVYSTTPSEGLGNAVTEAMANGLPCVLSDLPMLHEIVGNEKNAIFYEYKNVTDLVRKIEMLICDSNIRCEFSKNAFQRSAEIFSAKKYLEKRLSYLKKS